MAVNEVRVEHGKRGRVGRRRHRVRKQRPELEERRKPRFTFLWRAAPCWHDDDHGSAAFADDGHGLKRQFFGRRSGDLRAAFQNRFGLGERVNEQACADVGQSVQSATHRGHHAKVSAPAAQRPKQLGFVSVIGKNDASIGEDHLGFDEIVEREPATANWRPITAAKRQTGHADGADRTGHGGEAKRMGDCEYVRGAGAARYSRGAVGADRHASHSAQVDDDAVAQGAADPIVASATH